MTPSGPQQTQRDRLGSVTARGAVVTLGGQGARVSIQLASIVVLARLLTPRDFGLLAMVVIIIGIGEIFRDFGLSAAAIQAKTLSRAQRDNLFWANVSLGSALSLTVILCAPLIAAFYDQQALVALTRALAVVFLLNGMATQYRADLNRRMLFGRLALADVAGQSLGLGTGVWMALSGAGYWALVGQQVVQTATSLVIVVSLARWLPGRPRRGENMAGFMTFGWNMVSTQLIEYASRNLDSLIIGHRFGPGPLGGYNRAFQLLMVPMSQIRAPTTTVALPVLSRLQDDQARYSSYLARGQIAMGYTMVAGVALAAGAADPLIMLCLGEQWRSVVPLFQILAVACTFQTLSYVGFWVYLSRGLTAALLRYTMVSAVLRSVCILVGSNWGVTGVAAGFAVGPLLEWPLSLWWLSRLTVIPVRAFVHGASRILLLASLSAASANLAVMALDGYHPAVQLLAAALASSLVYVVGGVLSRRIRQDERGVLEILERVFRK